MAAIRLSSIGRTFHVGDVQLLVIIEKIMVSAGRPSVWLPFFIDMSYPDGRIYPL